MYSKTVLNYFTILEMSPTNDLASIKKSYRTIAMKYHPDRNPGNINAAEWFKKINEAFEFLSNPMNLRQDLSPPIWMHTDDRDLWDAESQVITKGGQHGFQIEIPPGMTLERFMEILKTDPNIKDLDVNLPYMTGKDMEPNHQNLSDKNRQHLGACSPDNA